MAGMPLLSGRDFMRGPGVDDSGPAIQLPANGPSPLSLVRALPGIVASPGVTAAQQPVASPGPLPSPANDQTAGANPSPMTAQGLGRALFGDGAINAAQQATAATDQGNYAQGLGAGVRALGAAAVHPYVAAADAIGTIGHAAAGAVNNFATGLMGSTPAAALPAQVARAAAAPAAASLAAAPVASTMPALSEEQAAAVRQRFGFGDPIPAAASAASAAQPNSFEKEFGLPAGGQMRMIAAAPPAKRIEMMTAMHNISSTGLTDEARSVALGLIKDRHIAGMTAAGNDTAKQNAVTAQTLHDVFGITSPSAYAATAMPTTYAPVQ